MLSVIKRDKVNRTIALLAALCLFLSTIEYLIPKPVPFMRLGLANLPILISLIILTPRQILFLILLKVLGQGLVNGTLYSYIFLFSSAGSFSSGLIMILFKTLFGKRISLIGISISGAAASNIIQILLAGFLIFGETAWIIAPPFLITGTITSIILGIFANRFIDSSRWISLVKGELNSE